MSATGARRRAVAVVVGCVVGCVLFAGACAPLASAVRASQRGDHDAAAAGFCELATSAEAPKSDVDEAQYGFARSLEQLGYVLAAHHVRIAISEAGSTHTFFVHAVAELAEAAQRNDDVTFIAIALDKAYTPANQRALASLQPKALRNVHYALANLVLKDARLFAKTIPAGHPAFERAQLTLAADDDGLKALRRERKQRSTAIWRDALAAERARLASAPPASPCVSDAITRAHVAIDAVLK